MSLDESVGAKELPEVKAVTSRFRGLVTIDHVDGEFTTDISGGEAITGNGGRCSLGFNVTDGSTDYFSNRRALHELDLVLVHERWRVPRPDRR